MFSPTSTRLAVAFQIGDRPCPRCLCSLPAEAYRRRGTSALQGYCRSCDNAWHRQRRVKRRASRLNQGLAQLRAAQSGAEVCRVTRLLTQRFGGLAGLADEWNRHLTAGRHGSATVLRGFEAIAAIFLEACRVQAARDAARDQELDSLPQEELENKILAVAESIRADRQREFVILDE